MVALLVAGCAREGGGRRVDDRIGVTSDGRRVELVLALCPDERIQAVELRDGDAGNGATPLWRVEAAEATAAAQVVVGDVPEGFDVAVPFAGQLPERSVVTAELLDEGEQGSSTPFVSFTMDRLEHGRLWTGSSQQLGRTAFFDQREEACS